MSPLKLDYQQQEFIRLEDFLQILQNKIDLNFKNNCGNLDLLERRPLFNILCILIVTGFIFLIIILYIYFYYIKKALKLSSLKKHHEKLQEEGLLN